MLYYVPLEPYAERYTGQLSRAKTGWFERNWIKVGVEYARVGSSVFADDRKSIKVGKVLDACQRGVWSLGQIENLLILLDNGRVTDADTIYFDDFWTPGFEALPYAFHLYGVRPKMYAYCWAQSVDEYDFTHPMRPWIKWFEMGVAECLTGVFVASTGLKRALTRKTGIDPKKVHVVGLPYCSDEVAEHYEGENPPGRNKDVVFSSRWDPEKQPDFFQTVARKVHVKNPDVRFKVVSGSKTKFRWPGGELKREFKEAIGFVGPELMFLDGISKAEYYYHLRSSRVQFNCALQDWVSFTLLEAAQAGCHPVYPNFRSFPETFLNRKEYLYEPWDADQAADMILRLMAAEDGDHWSHQEIVNREWIYDRFDLTWARVLWFMGFREWGVAEAFASRPDGQRHPYHPDKLFWEGE